MTMHGISDLLSKTLSTNTDFIQFCTDRIGKEFEYFINADCSTIYVPLPYFSIVTYDSLDDKGVSRLFKTQWLIGIAREDPTREGNITKELPLTHIEDIAIKAIEVITKELRTFGVEGDKNIHISYVNMSIPYPDGEDGLQLQVDIEFEKEKLLSC